MDFRKVQIEMLHLGGSCKEEDLEGIFDDGTDPVPNYLHGY